MTRSVRALVIVLAVLSAVVAVRIVGCGPGNVPSGQPPLLAISDDTLPMFRDAFNAAADEHRAVLLLSPT
jgi:hypothetical protein